MGLSILLPLDGSTYASAARRVALQIAQGQPKSRITALHVVNVRPGSGNVLEDLGGRLGFEPAVVADEKAEAANARGEEILNAFATEAKALGVEVDARLVTGVVAQTILDHAQQADLVIMGLRGTTDDRFPGQGGEMISWLVPRVDVPMLMLPRSTRQVQRVALGYDGSVGAKHAVRAVRRVFEGVPVAIHAIYVSRDGSGGEILDEVDRALPEQTVTHHVVQGTSAHASLAEESARLNADVIALGFRGKNKLKDVLFGSVTERFEIDGTVGLLVAH